VLRRVLAIAVAAPWVAWALIRTLGLDTGHPVVAAMSYTPYVALTSPLPVVAALLLRRRVTAAVAGVAVLAFAFTIAPRALAGGGPDARGPRLVVMTANLYEGHGDAEALMALVRRYHVDVLSLQEVTPSELERLDAAGAASALPARVAEPRPGASGTALLARVPLAPLPSADAGDHAQPAARLTISGAPPVALTAVHPAPPLSDAREAVWSSALDALPGAETGRLRILAGDFNATLDHRALRGVLGRGYADSAERAGAGLRPTWPALRRRALPITIDHVLVDRRIRVEGVHVEHVPGSDHRALIAELRLPADLAVAQ
jgi:endonuclease/exonuclease/phosphatase (EEP) superfamily protein YafD